jgi:hypothetical protein
MGLMIATGEPGEEGGASAAPALRVEGESHAASPIENQFVPGYRWTSLS